jgi:succinyl-diaminopimelate desuccinylase
MSATVDLTLDLISRNSVTPADQGCQEVMTRRLAEAGFKIENLRYGSVDNFWATRGGAGPVLCFAGHTDVVPTGPLENGTAIHSSPRCATACSTGAAPPT